MQSLKFKFLLAAIGCFICSLLTVVISLYIKPLDVVNLNAGFVFFSAGIYILSMNRRNSDDNNNPLVKSKAIINILLPILIIFDCLLFYFYLFAIPIKIYDWVAIDNSIIGQFAIISICWIGTIINLKPHKKNS